MVCLWNCVETLLSDTTQTVLLTVFLLSTMSVFWAWCRMPRENRKHMNWVHPRKPHSNNSLNSLHVIFLQLSHLHQHTNHLILWSGHKNGTKAIDHLLERWNYHFACRGSKYYHFKCPELLQQNQGTNQLNGSDATQIGCEANTNCWVQNPPCGLRQREKNKPMWKPQRLREFQHLQLATKQTASKTERSVSKVWKIKR